MLNFRQSASSSRALETVNSQSSSASVIEGSTGKPYEFGRDSRLIGVVTEPRRGSNHRTGLVAWGLGVAELRAARRLSQLGLTSLQVRRRNNERGRLALEGVEICQEAISELHARRDLDRFILMGNCAEGSVCFNTALVEPRITGLILTNPLVSDRLTYWPSVVRKLRSQGFWRRTFSRRENIGRQFQRLFSSFGSTLSHARTEGEQIIQSRSFGAAALPENLTVALGQLASRNVHILIVCAEGDASLDYFRSAFGRDFHRLRSLANVTIEVAASEAHVFSQDVSAASGLEEIISRWAVGVGIVCKDIKEIAADSDRRSPPRADVRDALIDILKGELNLHASHQEIHDGQLKEDLGMDSVMMIEFIGIIEDRFNFEFSENDLQPETFDTVESVVAVVAARVGNASSILRSSD